MKPEEVDALRQMLDSEGWEVLSGVLEARLTYLARKALMEEHDPLTSAEARFLVTMLRTPVVAVEEFDVRESERREDQRWVESTLSDGFRMAGFPGRRVNLGPQREETP